MAFDVPTIDLSSAKPGDVTDALVAGSCAFLVGHDVDPGLMAGMVETSLAFFDLPREEKAAVRWDGEGRWRGWQPVDEGSSDLTGDRAPDLLQRFEVQLAGDKADPLALQASFALWPERPAEMRAVWTRYYLAMGALAARLTSDMAETLGLPGEALTAWTEDWDANLVAIDYPAQHVAPEPGQLRIGAHTDRGGMTLLWADDAPGGLEVMLVGNREWVPVTIPEGAYLVQIGDMLARWTNRVVKPNVHRVVNPPADVAATSRRLSIPYFHYPNLDTVIEPAPSCVSADRPAGKPLHARTHFFARQEGYRDRKEGDVEEVLKEYAPA